MHLRNVVFIISPSPLHDDPIQYRRHRLLEYLNHTGDKDKFIWISPLPDNDISSLMKSPILTKDEQSILHLNVKDTKSLISHIGLLQRKLRISVSKHRQKADRFILWYTCPIFSSLAKLDLWDTVIYDCSDMWTEAEHLPKLKKRMIARSERKIVSTADLCFASSSHLRDHLLSLGRDNVTLIENGVDFNQFSRTHDKGISFDEKPVLGFVGGLKPWKIDFNLLYGVAQEKPDWEIVLIGSTYDPMPKVYSELRSLPNVTIIDNVPNDEIAAYIQQFDVGLLPYLDNDYNRGVFPLKFFEYLACGVPIVGCGLPSTRHYEESHVFEHVTSSVSDFVQACQQALEVRDTKVERRQAIAEQADWNEKFKQMWNQVQDVIEQKS